MSEFPCPVDGCGTGLQRSLGGTVLDGVLAHLKTVHRCPAEIALAKYRNQLAAIQEGMTSS